MTKIQIAQLAAQLTVGAVTNKFVQSTLQKNTNLSEIPTSVVGALTGAVVADKLKPRTDLLVMDIAARIQNLRHKTA